MLTAPFRTYLVSGITLFNARAPAEETLPPPRANGSYGSGISTDLDLSDPGRCRNDRLDVGGGARQRVDIRIGDVCDAIDRIRPGCAAHLDIVYSLRHSGRIRGGVDGEVQGFVVVLFHPQAGGRSDL